MTVENTHVSPVDVRRERAYDQAMASKNPLGRKAAEDSSQPSCARRHFALCVRNIGIAEIMEDLAPWRAGLLTAALVASHRPVRRKPLRPGIAAGRG
jgi:hypothetical protein